MFEASELFDLKQTEHAALFEGCAYAWDALKKIHGEVEAGSAEFPDPDFFVTRHYGDDELLPWDFIDHHIYKWFLAAERKKAHFEHQSPPCDVERCTVCGAC
jgi:hypothetical protein